MNIAASPAAEPPAAATPVAAPPVAAPPAAAPPVAAPSAAVTPPLSPTATTGAAPAPINQSPTSAMQSTTPGSSGFRAFFDTVAAGVRNIGGMLGGILNTLFSG